MKNSTYSRTSARFNDVSFTQELEDAFVKSDVLDDTEEKAAALDKKKQDHLQKADKILKAQKEIEKICRKFPSSRVAPDFERNPRRVNDDERDNGCPKDGEEERNHHDIDSNSMSMLEEEFDGESESAELDGNEENDVNYVRAPPNRRNAKGIFRRTRKQI